jgi:hypothetical protein
MPLVLSDSQIDHIALVARPLQPTERAAFPAALFQDLIMHRAVPRLSSSESHYSGLE